MGSHRIEEFPLCEIPQTLADPRNLDEHARSMLRSPLSIESWRVARQTGARLRIFRISKSSVVKSCKGLPGAGFPRESSANTNATSRTRLWHRPFRAWSVGFSGRAGGWKWRSPFGGVAERPADRHRPEVKSSSEQPPVPDLPSDAQNRFSGFPTVPWRVRGRAPARCFSMICNGSIATLDLLAHLATHSKCGTCCGQCLSGQRSSPRACGRWKRSAKPERGSTRSRWRLLDSTMSASSSPAPCIANRSVRGPWRNWCRRRLAEIRCLRSSSSRRWPKRD